MNDFDDGDLDLDLRGRLRVAAGAEPDVGAAHRAVSARVGAVRRRRAVATSSAAAILLLGGAAAASFSRQDAPRLVPASPTAQESATVAPTVVDDVTVTTADESPTSGDDPVTSGDDALEASTGNGAVPTPGPFDTATAVPTVTSSEPDDGPTVTSHNTPATTPPAAPAATSTYTSQRGSITVRWNGEKLTLVSTNPTGTAEAHVEHNEANRIDVRFTTDHGESRIEVRVVDGKLVPQITDGNHGDSSSGESGPPTNPADD